MHRGLVSQGLQTFDRSGGGAFLALIVTAPIMAVVALAIFITMGSPVILRQDRVGLFGKVFTLYKFRTMAPDQRTTQVEFVGDDRRLTHKSANDPRITPLGGLLRRTRLDELPQFFNVLQGRLEPGRSTSRDGLDRCPL